MKLTIRNEILFGEKIKYKTNNMFILAHIYLSPFYPFTFSEFIILSIYLSLYIYHLSIYIYRNVHESRKTDITFTRKSFWHVKNSIHKNIFQHFAKVNIFLHRRILWKQIKFINLSPKNHILSETNASEVYSFASAAQKLIQNI